MELSTLNKTRPLIIAELGWQGDRGICPFCQNTDVTCTVQKSKVGVYSFRCEQCGKFGSLLDAIQARRGLETRTEARHALEEDLGEKITAPKKWPKGPPKKKQLEPPIPPPSPGRLFYEPNSVSLFKEDLKKAPKEAGKSVSVTCPYCGEKGDLVQKYNDGVLISHEIGIKRIKSEATGKMVNCLCVISACAPTYKIRNRTVTTWMQPRIRDI